MVSFNFLNLNFYDMNLNDFDENNPPRDFSFVSLKQAMAKLDCSKFYINKLRRKKILKAHYLEMNDKGEPTGKPYFNLREIEKVLFLGGEN